MEGLLRWLGSLPLGRAPPDSSLELEAPLASIATFLGGTFQLPQLHTGQREAEQHHSQQQLRGFGRWRGRRRQQQAQFACQVCVEGGAQPACHQLVATGSKIWGIGSILPIARIYDFALYVDGQKTGRSQLAAQLAGQLDAAPHKRDAFYMTLRRSTDIDFSLVVRASRNLPIRVMQSEYRRILRARLALLGHSMSDQGLQEMLDALSEDRLPGSIKRGGAVVKGTTFTFSKRGDGRLLAAVDGVALSEVQSPALCAAMMDVYLGVNPVSKRARRAAGERIVHMLGGPQAPPPPPACSLERHICRLGCA